MSDSREKHPDPSSTPRLELGAPVDTGPPVSQAGYGGAGYGYGPGYGDGSNPLDIEESHLLDYVRIVYKRRWTALTVFLITVTTVAVYTFTATPIYLARAQMLIEVENPNVVSFKEVIDQEARANDYYQTQYKILQSRSLVRRTLQALQLWDTPQEVPATPASESFWVALGSTVSNIKQLIAPVQVVTEPPGPDKTPAQARALDAFVSSLTIDPIRNSRLIDITFQSPDPVYAARATNALAKAYIEQNLEFRFTSSKEASDWLSARLGEQRKLVEASEAAVQRYREQNDAVSLEERQNIVVQKLADLNAALTKAKTDRIQKEAAYDQLRTIQNDQGALDTFPAILANGYIQSQKAVVAELQRQQAQLSERLGDNHPEMVKLRSAIQSAELKLQGEIGKVVESVRNEYLAMLAQERSLTAALDAQKAEAMALNRKGIGYGVLVRDAASNRVIFESLMQRTKETGISGELRTSNIRIVDLAEVPRRSIRPNRTLNMLFALLGGSTLGVGFAFFFHYVDNKIKSPAEVKAYLGLPFLGLLPSVLGPDGATPLISNGAPSTFTEALRAIRTNVLFASAEDGGKSILVTSTAPGEGKTVVAVNLAIGLAQAGQRVLLIDGDLRRARIHDVFGQPAEPGLSNVLVGNAKASEAVRSAPVGGLWILTCGAHPPNPAELLGSKRFHDFLATLTTHFDWIVIDSPPVLLVTDAAVLAHKTTGVVFVVGAEMTARRAAETAVAQLTSAKVRFVGGVLNRVDFERSGYYYSQYYSRKYGNYYTDSPS